MNQSQTMNKKFKWVNVVIAIAVTLGVAVFIFCVVSVGGYFIERSWSKPTPCEKLLSDTETQVVLKNNIEFVAKVGKLGGFEVSLMPRSDCPGKAEIFIYYSTFSQGKKIRELIGDTFKGLPYRMANM
jgi:hypothetical protein